MKYDTIHGLIIPFKVFAFQMSLNIRWPYNFLPTIYPQINIIKVFHSITNLIALQDIMDNVVGKQISYRGLKKYDINEHCS